MGLKPSTVGLRVAAVLSLVGLTLIGLGGIEGWGTEPEGVGCSRRSVGKTGLAAVPSCLEPGRDIGLELSLEGSILGSGGLSAPDHGDPRRRGTGLL
jgi:hypothetical protein